MSGQTAVVEMEPGVGMGLVVEMVEEDYSRLEEVVKQMVVGTEMVALVVAVMVVMAEAGEGGMELGRVNMAEAGAAMAMER